MQGVIALFVMGIWILCNGRAVNGLGFIRLLTSPVVIVVLLVLSSGFTKAPKD